MPTATSRSTDIRRHARTADKIELKGAAKVGVRAANAEGRHGIYVAEGGGGGGRCWVGRRAQSEEGGGGRRGKKERTGAEERGRGDRRENLMGKEREERGGEGFILYSTL